MDTKTIELIFRALGYQLETVKSFPESDQVEALAKFWEQKRPNTVPNPEEVLAIVKSLSETDKIEWLIRILRAYLALAKSSPRCDSRAHIDKALAIVEMLPGSDQENWKENILQHCLDFDLVGRRQLRKEFLDILPEPSRTKWLEKLLTSYLHNSYPDLEETFELARLTGQELEDKRVIGLLDRLRLSSVAIHQIKSLPEPHRAKWLIWYLENRLLNLKSLPFGLASDMINSLPESDQMKWLVKILDLSLQDLQEESPQPNSNAAKIAKLILSLAHKQARVAVS